MDPILLQKQIRDNSEELQKQLRELKNWEEEMKRKENEQTQNSEETRRDLPPVRSKIMKKAPEVNPKSTENGGILHVESKSIKNQLNQSDVEKTTEKVNNVSLSSSEIMSSLEEAIYEKENGNRFVKIGKWQEAIECYTRAIGHDPNNAIFYANRAQCSLKLEKWQEVLNDCTKALSIEKGYVKAYLRRAAAHVKLKNFYPAIDDLNDALMIEPANKEAKTVLADAKAQLKKHDAEKAAQASKEDVNRIIAISKPPHLRSKVPLKKIPIEEVGAGITPRVFEGSLASTPTTSASSTPSISSKPSTPVKSTPSSPKKVVTEIKPDFAEQLPPPPKTAVQFMLAWGQLRPEHRFAYLLQLPGKQLPHIFGDALESRELTEILATLSTSPKDARVIDYLEGITEIRRFSTLTLFMSSQDKKNIQQLLERSLTENHCTADQMHALKVKYEL